LYGCIEQYVRTQFHAYGSSSLSSIWKKSDKYSLNASDATFELLLKRAGSFAGVTRRLILTEMIITPKLFDLLSTPTGRNTTVQVIENIGSAQHTIYEKTITETVGQTLRVIEFFKVGLDCKFLNLVCNIECLEMKEMSDIVFPESEFVLSNLKELYIDSDLPEFAYLYLARLAPNLESLRLGVMWFSPKCFVDYCPNLKTIIIGNINQEGDSSVSDADVLYMLEHLNNLKRLNIDSTEFTGSAFKQLDSKSLQHLHISTHYCSDGDHHHIDAYVLGGQLPSLKQFYFNRNDYDLCESTEESLGQLFKSVIDHCPNISRVSIKYFSGDDYPCNLYGLVPTKNISELNFYSGGKTAKYHKDQSVPGVNVLQTIMNMEDNWQEIAQSRSVKIVNFVETPSKEVLDRCKWPNVHVLNIGKWRGFIDNIEWLNSLIHALPNLRYLQEVDGDFLDLNLCDTLRQVLTDNTIWPDLIAICVMNEIENEDGLEAIFTARPRLMITPDINNNGYECLESESYRGWDLVKTGTIIEIFR
jgi:hypothetical protein